MNGKISCCAVMMYFTSDKGCQHVATVHNYSTFFSPSCVQISYNLLTYELFGIKHVYFIYNRKY